MNTHEFFRALYFSEIERKHYLTNALTVPTGIATILGGVIAYYVRSFDWQDIDAIGVVFVVLLFVSVLLLSLMIYHLGKNHIDESLTAIWLMLTNSKRIMIC